jgi:hypothetical protein
MVRALGENRRVAPDRATSGARAPGEFCPRFGDSDEDE